MPSLQKVRIPFNEKISLLKRRRFFGEMSLVTNQLTSASVKALEPTEVLILLKIDFQNMLEENKQFADEIKHIVEKRRFDARFGK
ncbi:MAG: cyclic nucleotide-binding domain-containing protein [Elusimicrobiota bacterium]|nr:cyclic nucleotide-binding domain-containing protein [Elusimicrobiota bacterium]